MKGFVSYKYIISATIFLPNQGLVFLLSCELFVYLGCVVFWKRNIVFGAYPLSVGDVCFTPKRQATSSFTCIKQNEGLLSDLNWRLLMSYPIKSTTLYKRGFPWLMFCTKVTFERFLKFIQSIDMLDLTLKKLLQ